MAAPSPELDTRVAEARERGLHLRQMGSNRIVIAPPCTTTVEEADEIVDILKPMVAAIAPPA